MIRFPPWTPDHAILNKNNSEVITNVVPTDAGYYAPAFGLDPIATASLSSSLLGIKGFRNAQGFTYTVAGTSTKLYKYDASSETFIDISGTTPYVTASDGWWDFAIHNNKILATNSAQPVQVLDTAAASVFANLGGTPPQCKIIATVGRFAVLGGIYNSLSSVRWSAFDDPTSWTIGANQADEQVFARGGTVRGIVGGEYMTVFMDNAIHIGTYTGPNDIFQFDELTTDIGIDIDRSLASAQGRIFFHSPLGFYSLSNGNNFTAIGEGKVDSWFINNVNYSYLHKITSIVDTKRKLYLISFVTNGSVTGIPDTILAFNWASGQWSKITIDHNLLSTAVLTGTPLTIDGMASFYSTMDSAGSLILDSLGFVGGLNLEVVTTNTSNVLCTFTGNSLAATLQTAEHELVPNRKAFVRSIRPLVNGSSAISAKMYYRDILSSSTSSTSAIAVDTTGQCGLRANGRYMRAEVSIAAGGSWTLAQGVDLDVAVDNRR